MSTINKVKGTRDYFEKEAEILSFAFLKLNRIAKSFGYKWVDFSILEHAELFSRAVGKETDIVSKEMFSFKDKSERNLVLRPEGTSSVVRMILENKLVELEAKKNYFYINKMFRYENPQKGRQREFYQFGIESFNEKKYHKDVEIISMAIMILKEFLIKDFNLEINYLGSKKSRDKYKIALKEYLKKDFSNLSIDSKKRFEKNILRILDSKDKNDKEILKNAPKITDYLESDEKENFFNILKELKENDINFNLNPKLVRGLDYYNNLVFEFVSSDNKNIGAQNTIIGGGRYDDLVEILNHKKNVPAIGFALGIERLISASPLMNEENLEKEEILYLLAKTPKEEKYLNRAARILREKYNVLIKYNSDKNLTKRIAQAKKNGATHIGIINKEFEKTGNIEVKKI
ncbi:MAG: histidine--tRNA ligase [Candidatus Hepatoplasma vulgare]|nr:MAG: histidine--tRNA ligase [Candidatus Hepatoplasma sp.]